MEDNKALLQTVIDVCEDRQAGDCLVLDMKHLTPMADYYVICHGNNERQVQAIARTLKDTVEEQGFEVRRMEGYEQARWILVDLNNIICHIFHKDDRSYYNLERLWGDAEEVSVKDI